jgi:hypothetical protein
MAITPTIVYPLFSFVWKKGRGKPMPKEGTLSGSSGEVPPREVGALLYHYGMVSGGDQNKGRKVGPLFANTMDGSHIYPTMADAFTPLATGGAFGIVPGLALADSDTAKGIKGREAGFDHPMPVDEAGLQSLVAKAHTPRTNPLGGGVHQYTQNGKPRNASV